MARTRSDPTVVRPSCPEHPDSRVRLDGFERCGWSDAHRRPRYRCVTVPGTRGHSFSVPVAVRQPTERHPDSGVACPTCEHVYGRHEGVRTGRDFVFGHAEIARLFLRVGEGMSLRAASRSCASRYSARGPGPASSVLAGQATRRGSPRSSPSTRSRPATRPSEPSATASVPATRSRATSRGATQGRLRPIQRPSRSSPRACETGLSASPRAHYSQSDNRGRHQQEV